MSALSLQPFINRLTGRIGHSGQTSMRELIKMPKAISPELVELVRLLRKQWANQRYSQECGNG